MNNWEIKPHLRVIKGGGEGSKDKEPRLEAFEGIDEELEISREALKEALSNPDRERKRKQRKKYIEQLAKYDLSLLNSQDRLIEFGNTNATRLHHLFTTIIFLTRDATPDSPTPEGDIQQYVEDFILEVLPEDEMIHIQARAIIACGAVDMLKDMLNNQLRGEGRTFMDTYPSPTWDIVKEDKIAAQDNIANTITKLIYLTGHIADDKEKLPQEKVIEYLDELKRVTVETVGLTEEEQIPSEEMFLKNWRVLIKLDK